MTLQHWSQTSCGMMILLVSLLKLRATSEASSLSSIFCLQSVFSLDLDLTSFFAIFSIFSRPHRNYATKFGTSMWTFRSGERMSLSLEIDMQTPDNRSTRRLRPKIHPSLSPVELQPSSKWNSRENFDIEGTPICDV